MRKLRHRVVHLVDHASRQDGGIFESLLGFANEQATYRDWDVHVAAIKDTDTASDRERFKGVSLLLTPQAEADFFGKRLARLVNAVSPDLIHVHGVWGPAARAAWQLSRRQIDLGVIVSPHGMLDPWALGNNRWKKQLGWQIWAKPLLKRADILHALGTPEQAAVEAVMPGTEIAVIANGVQLPPRSTVLMGNDAPTLLFLGRIHPKKGLPALIDACAALGSRLGRWRLAIAGWDDGGHENELRAQVDLLGLGEHVSFVGPVFGQAKDAMLKSANAFILPSQSEGLPMAVLEAWSYGLPVLMTRECNLTEGFTAAAAIEHRPECNSIAQALDSFFAMTIEDRQSMGNHGRDLVERKFSWPTVAKQMTDTYQDVLSRRRGSRLHTVNPDLKGLNPLQ